MIDAYLVDAQGVYIGTVSVDPLGPQPAGAAYAPPPPTTGSQVAKWDGVRWVVLPEHPVKQEVTPALSPATPQEVTRFQARGALYQAGLLDKVETFIAAEGTDMMLKLAWQDAQTFKRYSPFITGVGNLLGLTDAQLDALFMSASLIE